MNKVSRALFISFAAVILSGSAIAHHGLSRFDTSQNISIDGAIVRVQWVNPHVYIFIQTTDDTGRIVEWELEGPPPAMLRRAGWTRESLQVGDRITASGNPTTNSDSHLLFATAIQPLNVMGFDQNSSINILMDGGDAVVAEASSLEGKWLTLLSPLQLQIYNGQGGEEGLTEKGLNALRRFDEATMNPAVNCTRNPAPASMVMPDVKRITFEKDSVSIESNYDSATRVIYLESRNSAESLASNQGFTTGRLEGNVLFLETTDFADHAMGNRWGVPSGSQKFLRERIELNPDGKSISYSYELADPEYLTETVTGSAEWVYRPDLEFATFECDLEASRRFLIP